MLIFPEHLIVVWIDKKKTKKRDNQSMPERQADAVSGEHPFDEKKQRNCRRANKKLMNPKKEEKKQGEPERPK